MARCFDSLCGQTLRDIEIILVDDGSTDGSLKVCRDYQGRDERVRVISKENGGTTAARKTGFELARGEYVAFCDCDDYMPATALQDLYDAAKQTRSDMVMGGIKRVLGKFTMSNITGKHQITIEQPELFRRYYLSYFGMNLLPVNIWGRIYRKELLDDVAGGGEVLFHDDVRLLAGDEYFNLMLHPHLKSVTIINKPTYCYRWGGMSCRYDPHITELFTMGDLRVDLLDKYQYEVGYHYLFVEYKNVLHSWLVDFLQYKQGTLDDACRMAQRELENRYLVSRMKDYYARRPQELRPELDDVVCRRADAIVGRAAQAARQGRKRLWMKKALFGLLSGYKTFAESYLPHEQ